MGSFLDVTINYLQMKQAQFSLIQLNSVGLGSELELFEYEVAEDAAIYASDISPFVSGSLSASHIVTPFGRFTLVHIDETAVNPFSPENPHEYGPEVHAMGGHRAFYTRTVDEYGDILVKKHGDAYVARLEAIF